MASLNLVNIGSGKGLVPDGTKPIPEPIYTPSLKFCGICLRAVPYGMLQDVDEKKYKLGLMPNLPVTIELTKQPQK